MIYTNDVYIFIYYINTITHVLGSIDMGKLCTNMHKHNCSFGDNM